jgi:ankyrin repeat protein
MTTRTSEEQLYDFCFRGDTEWAKAIVARPNIDINWRKEPHLLTPLYVACQAGQAEIVQFLLSLSKLDPNVPSRTGVTPFSKACTEGHASLLKYLMADNRVDVNKSQETGSTPFFMACQNGYPKVVDILLKDPRIDLNRSRNDSTSPFYKACEKGHIEVVRVILKSKASIDVNRAQSTGVTPFYLACERGNSELVALLLEDPRVDINRPKEDGATPLFVAAQNGHLACAERILASNRFIEYKKKARFNNNNPAEQGRAMANRVRKPEESEEDHHRKKVYGPKIADLIDAFDKDPIKIRASLRSKFGQSGNCYLFVCLFFFLSLPDILTFFQNMEVQLITRDPARPFLLSPCQCSL